MWHGVCVRLASIQVANPFEPSLLGETQQAAMPLLKLLRAAAMVLLCIGPARVVADARRRNTRGTCCQQLSHKGSPTTQSSLSALAHARLEPIGVVVDTWGRSRLLAITELPDEAIDLDQILSTLHKRQPGFAV
jgi:hypothetical protein